MRRTAAALALLAAVAVAGREGAHAAGPRMVVDAAGRRVTVPERIERVYAAGGPASILVYALAPAALLGWSRPPTSDERAFLPARYGALPAMGRLTGRGNTANVEAVLAARPDVILDYGSTATTYATLADRVQQQTGVPYLLFDGRLSAIPEALVTVGDLLNAGERGRALGQEARRILNDVDERLRHVAADARPRVYYARGPRGLESARPGSINVESLERMGARNVAGEAGVGGNIVTVSLEQVLGWDPDVIVTIDPTFYAAVRSDPLWRGVRAVRRGRVYLAPLVPFAWIDFPPSVNRLIGLRWLGHVLYPDVFREDLRQETRTFYTRFYHRAPDEAQLDALLAGTAGR